MNALMKNIERSAGIILVHNTHGVPYFLLVRHKNGRHWGFPKGHRLKRECALDAALRECLEETHIRPAALCIHRRFYERYQFRRGSRRRRKVVSYFLGFARTKHVRLLRSEVTAYAWLPYDAARKKITYATAKRILDRAYAHVRVGHQKVLRR